MFSPPSFSFFFALVFVIHVFLPVRFGICSAVGILLLILLVFFHRLLLFPILRIKEKKNILVLSLSFLRKMDYNSASSTASVPLMSFDTWRSSSSLAGFITTYIRVLVGKTFITRGLVFIRRFCKKGESGGEHNTVRRFHHIQTQVRRKSQEKDLCASSLLINVMQRVACICISIP